MIDLRETNVKGSYEEQQIINRMETERLPYRFGEVKTGKDRQPNIILSGRFAISFKPFQAAVESVLKANKFVPQVWNKEDLSWRALSLNRQLLLHR